VKFYLGTILILAFTWRKMR